MNNTNIAIEGGWAGFANFICLIEQKKWPIYLNGSFIVSHFFSPNSDCLSEIDIFYQED